ncbi:hypothetical protein B0H63DRAFT_398226 [Podospora didyma]|uniref:tRNA-intron lyase n=1 Tax=Podospora didyma TaxID=330526 RepID=A0AAE0NCF4_9PEZI|nr:hypothetical protein B0H63DRAFT_398226 [Podospora didyma]
MAETTTITMSPPGTDDSGHAKATLFSEPVATTTSPSPSTKSPSPPRIPLYKVYALPAPIKTFPLPSFNPSNPLSLLHLACAWVWEIVAPPPAEPSVIHQGFWDPATRSVHISDPSSIRALWEQGFFGKGSLSRSEPNWLKREISRRGSEGNKTVSEERTEARREERRLSKWERAKLELEAIELQRSLEQTGSRSESLQGALLNDHLADATPVDPQPSSALPKSLGEAAQIAPVQNGSSKRPLPPATEEEVPRTSESLKEPVYILNGGLDRQRPPTDPRSLLALPNSLDNDDPGYFLRVPFQEPVSPDAVPAQEPVSLPKSPVGPAELLSLPNSSKPMDTNGTVLVAQANGHADSKAVDTHALSDAINGLTAKASALTFEDKTDDVLVNGTKLNGDHGAHPPPSPTSPQAAKRRKSVRFSPNISSTTFLSFDPPSPKNRPGAPQKIAGSTLANGNGSARASVPPPAPAPPAAVEPTVPPVSATTSQSPVVVGEIQNREHFQLSPEEAFFLVFSVGALAVYDPVTKALMAADKLLSLLRANSFFPPRDTGSLQPDDPFLVKYAVYHHYRSLGWIPRDGVKFGSDLILYQRGPVFDHSEFSIKIIPSHSGWKEHHQYEKRKVSWSDLMGLNRVSSHVLKSLVLVYVDTPSPEAFDEAMRVGGIAAALKKYMIREVMVRRFSVNRNR